MFIDLDSLEIGEKRMRKEFNPESLSTLAESLQRGMGLMHPVVVKQSKGGKYQLIAGERRIKAIKLIYDMEETFLFAGEPVPKGQIPVTVSTELDYLDILKAERDENVQREDFQWLEEAAANAKIAALEQRILEEENPKATKAKSLMDISPEAMKNAAERISGKSGGSYTKKVQDAIEITNIVENDPEAKRAFSKAKSFTEGQKVLKKRKNEELYQNLAAVQGRQFKADTHKIILGDCLEVMPTLERGYFDICITDPIYGINAHKFGSSAGQALSFSHSYDDSPETWRKVIPQALKLMSKLMKPAAHVYIACDYHKYAELKELLIASGNSVNPWVVPNYPAIQYKKGGGRVPTPGYSLRRSYEVWLFAWRGDKQEQIMRNDVFESISDETETLGAAKPVELLKDFLARSTQPGDTCLDFMAGSGSIIPACHESKVECTAIELDDTAYGRCLQRVKELKAL